MEGSYCSDCKKTTQVVYDHSTGDTICCECGLVLEAHVIDDTSEWRNFAVEWSSSEDRDPSRVGAASNPLLNHTHLSTTISKPLDSAAGHAWHLKTAGGSNPDQTLIRGFGAIETMADRLSIVATIKHRASEIYKKVEDHKAIKGRKNREAILAACLYIACNEDHKPRTLKEICSVANGACQKEIIRAKKFIENQFKEEIRDGTMAAGTSLRAGDVAGRFCSSLSMKHRSIKAAREALEASEQLDIRRTPITVAAAVIYIITQLSSDDQKDIKDISAATGTAVTTIRHAYKDVYPYASRLIPSWFAQEQDLKNLITP